MNTEKNQTEETQADESQLNSPAGDEAVTQPESLSLDEINAITGMTYKTKEAALKSIKDMKSMAGKAASLEGQAPDIAKMQAQIADLTEREFLARNPQHEANLELLRVVAKGAGVSIQEAAELFAYTVVMQQPVEAQSKRTIAASNNRVAQQSTQEDVSAVHGDPLKSAEYVVNNFFKK